MNCTCYHLYLLFKISHFYVVICNTVNLCVFTDRLFIFRRYCNKNNTFTNAGLLEPPKKKKNHSTLPEHSDRKQTKTGEGQRVPSPI